MDSFYIIGISVRTINKDNQSGNDIGNLWNKWFSEDLSTKIPNKISDDIINMYTDYNSDEHDFYTAVLGHKVSSLDMIPEGFIGKHILDENYKEFISKGKLPECVLNTWEIIWNSKLDRKYTADFDVYNSMTMNPEDVEVITYLSIN